MGHNGLLHEKNYIWRWDRGLIWKIGQVRDQNCDPWIGCLEYYTLDYCFSSLQK